MQSAKYMVPFREEHIDSFGLGGERLQTHPKSTYYYHSKQPLPFLTASSPARSLKNQSPFFAATEAPNTNNSQLTHLQSHYPLRFQGSSSHLGSDWGQAPLIKYQEHVFGESSMRHVALCLKKKNHHQKKKTKNPTNPQTNIPPPTSCSFLFQVSHLSSESLQVPVNALHALSLQSQPGRAPLEPQPRAGLPGKRMCFPKQKVCCFVCLVSFISLFYFVK